MLSENIGFDVSELQFEQFAGEGKLYHVMVGREAGELGANPSESLNGSVHSIVDVADAVTFVQHSHKRVVCVSSTGKGWEEVEGKLSLLLLEKDAYVTRKGRRLSRLLFPTHQHVFGVYEWLAAMAGQKPQNQEEDSIIAACQQYLADCQPTKSTERYLTAIEQSFSGEQNLANREAMTSIGTFFHRIRKFARKALIIVDVQNDFCEGGSLAVPNSNAIFGPINELKKKINFQSVIITKDVHPQDHVSFASTHKTNPFITIDVDGEEQELWPDHCVRNTYGAEISHLLEVDGKEEVVEKGVLAYEDAYSGFGKKANPTPLLSILKQKKIQEVVVVGLALDFCVGSTALDSQESGFATHVVMDATRAVMSHTEKIMLGRLQANHVGILSLEQTISMFA